MEDVAQKVIGNGTGMPGNVIGAISQEAMDEVQMVVEGVYSAKAAVKLGEKYGVSLPIINKVSEVLFDGKDPKEAVNELMLRDNKAEHTALPWEK